LNTFNETPEKLQIQVHAPVVISPTKGGGGGEGGSVGMGGTNGQGEEKNSAVQKGDNNLYQLAP
jgi:hypothetical protein